MTPTHKKILIFSLASLLVLGIGVTSQAGRVIGMSDSIGAPEYNREVSSDNQVLHSAALSPSGIGDNEMKIGVRNPQLSEGVKDDYFSLRGAFRSSAEAFLPPFSQQADVFPPEVQAGLMVISDLTSGTHYLEKGVSRHWPIASITKLMTAVVASQVLSPDTKLTMSPSNFPTEEGTSTRSLVVGDEFFIRDIIQIMLIVSDNAAAEALAQAYGRDDFLAKMNAQAKAWGMNKTYFYDPSGLSPVNQSSIEDLEKMAYQLVRNHEDILRITQKPGVRVIEQGSGRERAITPINAFAGRSDFLGGKTGYIDEAGGNLLSIFSVQKRPILIVVLNSTARFDDTEILLDWFKYNFQ